MFCMAREGRRVFKKAFLSPLEAGQCVLSQRDVFVVHK